MGHALAAFRPQPAVPRARVVRRTSVPASAWHGLLRDGALRVVWGDVAVASDVRLTPELRALALSDLVPPRTVVGRGSALWVHTGAREPVRLEVLVERRAHHAAPHPWRTSTEADLSEGDVVRLAGVRVTTVQRTGTDLARCLPTPEALPLLARLVPLGFDATLASRTVAALRGHRHVRTASRTLAMVANGQARMDGSSAPLAPVIR